MLDFGFYNMDCMEGMKEFPDKYFDLAIVDPPYGIGVQTMQYTKTGNRRASRKSTTACRDYRRTAERLACEAIQIAAMALKFVDTVEGMEADDGDK